MSQSTTEKSNGTSKPGKPAPKITIADFLIGSHLGEGAYARVRHVKLKTTGNEYAMKVMEKRFIKREDKLHFVTMERKVLSSISHPFIMRLYYSFHDATHLYMAIDLCRGGELKHVIEKHMEANNNKFALPFSDTQFYTAEVTSAIQFLHSKGIVHRDLKPENILITEHGHVKVTDFGTAKDERLGGQVANDFVGTAEYVSPEVLLDKEPSVGADLWALGCMIFQMLVGLPPFQDANEYLTFQRILNHPKDRLEYPSFVPEQAVDLIDHLLVRDSTLRLGAAGDKTPFGGQENEIKRVLSVDDENDDMPLDVPVEDFIDDVNRDDNGPEKLRGHRFFDGINFRELLDITPPPIGKLRELPDPVIEGSSKNWMFHEEANELKQFGTKLALDEATPQKDLVEQFTVTPPRLRGSSPTSRQRASSILASFLEKGEEVLLDGLISKRKGLLPRTRHLILTNRPRLFYIDPVKLVFKGEIPWSNNVAELRTIPKPNQKVLDVFTPNRVYHLTLLVGQASTWATAIKDAQETQ